MARMIVILGSLALVAACGKEQAPKPIAEVYSLNPKVELRNARGTRPLRNGEDLHEGDEIIPEKGAWALIVFRADARARKVEQHFVLPKSEGSLGSNALAGLKEIVADYDREGALDVAAVVSIRGAAAPRARLPAGRIRGRDVRFRWKIGWKNPVVLVRIRIRNGDDVIVTQKVKGKSWEWTVPAGGAQEYSYTLEILSADGVEPTKDPEEQVDRRCRPVGFEVVAGTRGPRAKNWVQHLILGREYLKQELPGNALEELDAAARLRPEDPVIRRWLHKAQVAAGLMREKKKRKDAG